MKTVVRSKYLTYEQEQELLGKFLTEAHYDILVDEESTKVVREDGSVVCILLKAAIPQEEFAPMYKAIHNRITPTQNRATSSGQVMKKRKKKDGTISSTNIADKTVLSSVIGYFDRYPRIPYCRQTSFNENHPDLFKQCLPAIQRASNLMKEYLPDRWQAQYEHAMKTSEDFLIPGSVFTTVTLNKNFRTATHRDAGDLKVGFGVMSYMRSGVFKGGHLVLPTYRVALKMNTGDLVLFDPHEIHGNTPIEPVTEKYERITCVHYYREKMYYCGSAKDELERAKKFGAAGVGSMNLNYKDRPGEEGEDGINAAPTGEDSERSPE